MIPRRAFLRSVALASLATVFRPTGLQGAADAALRLAGRAEDALTPAALAALRGERFAMTTATGGVEHLVLEEIAVHSREPHIENFSISFRGAAQGGFTQGTRRMAHPELGEFDLFVVARADGTGACTYEAVFNRLV